LREYIELKHKIALPVYNLKQVLYEADKIVPEIIEKIKPLKYFEDYLRFGYYPFFTDSEANYPFRLANILNIVLESDLPAIFNVDYLSVTKIKKMLSIISRIVPYKPNIEKLARQSGTMRDTLLKYLYYLEKAEIVKWISKDTHGINFMNKPDKLYLNNTNLMFALNPGQPDKGTLRETFLLNQLKVNHTVSYPETGDFLVDGKFLIEAGGPSKSRKQIAGQQDAFLAVDDVEYPSGNRIPLWLFGFLY